LAAAAAREVIGPLRVTPYQLDLLLQLPLAAAALALRQPALEALMVQILFLELLHLQVAVGAEQDLLVA
jgi:hypothetical protein